MRTSFLGRVLALVLGTIYLAVVYALLLAPNAIFRPGPSLHVQVIGSGGDPAQQVVVTVAARAEHQDWAQCVTDAQGTCSLTLARDGLGDARQLEVRVENQSMLVDWHVGESALVVVIRDNGNVDPWTSGVR